MFPAFEQIQDLSNFLLPAKKGDGRIGQVIAVDFLLGKGQVAAKGVEVICQGIAASPNLLGQQDGFFFRHQLKVCLQFAVKVMIADQRLVAMSDVG